MPSELSPANQTVFDVFRRVVLGNEQVDIFRLMDAVGVKDQLECFDKVAMLIEELREKNVTR